MEPVREGSPTARRLERARGAAVDLGRMERAAAKAPGDGFADASAEARERCGAEVADADRAIWGAEGAVGHDGGTSERERWGHA